MKQENGKRAMTAGLRRTMVIFVLDLLCIAGSFFLALWMRFEFRWNITINTRGFRSL